MAKKAPQAASNTTPINHTFTHLPLQVELVGKSAITIIKEVRKSIPKTKDSQTFAGPLVATHKIGGLGCYSDGIIRFNEKEIPMRVQLRDICVLFICNPNQLVTSDDIYDVLEKAIPKTTIAKYVSELHTILQESIGRPVIKNLKSTGWKLNLTD